MPAHAGKRLPKPRAELVALVAERGDFPLELRRVGWLGNGLLLHIAGRVHCWIGKGW